MKTGREISSGGVVYRREGGKIQVVLIARQAKKIWGLPKGKIDPGEKPPQTALREVREETGLSGKIERKLGDIRYTYYAPWDDTRYSKVVSFYLMKYLGGSTADHDWEVEDAQWFDLDKALKKASYPGERSMLLKAKGILR